MLSTRQNEVGDNSNKNIIKFSYIHYMIFLFILEMYMPSSSMHPNILGLLKIINYSI